MKIKHHIHTFNVNPGKGEYIRTRWLVVQNRPYPCIRADGGRLNWSNMEGLVGKYVSPPTGLGSRYTCHLLIPEGEIPADYNWTHFAGYIHRPGPYGTPEVTNPGTIVYRGRDLGETTVSFEANPDYPTIRVNGHEVPSPGERQFIESQIMPQLAEYIRQNTDALRRDALAAVRERMETELAEKRRELDALGKSISDILANA